MNSDEVAIPVKITIDTIKNKLIAVIRHEYELFMFDFVMDSNSVEKYGDAVKNIPLGHGVEIGYKSLDYPDYKTFVDYGPLSQKQRKALKLIALMNELIK